MTAALAERIVAVLKDGKAASPRAVHRVLGGRYEGVQTALSDLLAQGLVTVEEKGGHRRLYSLVTGREATLIRRSRKLLSGIRSAGSVARSDCYALAGVGTADELDELLDRLVAEGLIVEDANRRLTPAPAELGLSPNAASLLAGIRAEGEDGLAPDQCERLLDGANPRPALGELVLAGLVVVHGDEFRWWVATEFDAPDVGPDSPNWNLDAKAALVIRRIAALGPQPAEVLEAAARRAGIDLRPGDLDRVAGAVGLYELNGEWRDDLRASNDQTWYRRYVLKYVSADEAINQKGAA